MLLPIAGALTLICVWSTTALAIKWSVTGIDFSAALFFRFAIAFMLMLLIGLFRNKRLSNWSKNWRAWLITGGSTAVAMLCTYWASQYISSGLVAVLHGLNPLATTFFVHLWLKQKSDAREIIGILLAVGGLATIFSTHLHLRADGIPALLAVLLAVLANSAAIVKLKAHAQGLDMFTVSTGSMGICALVFGVQWLLHGMPLPEVIPMRAASAILYLALVGSIFALSIYFWMVRECRPTQIALIPMITTTSALWFGHFLNDEALTRAILIGSALIIAGLALHQFGAWRAK